MMIDPLADPRHIGESHALRGLEADNLLAQLALLGLLEALEAAQPAWQPRASWRGPPWVAHLHVPAGISENQVARAAITGVTRVAGQYDTDGRKNVDFEPAEFRAYAARCLSASAVAARLAPTLACEHPRKRDGGLSWGPLVMMFGQGWQNFLERLVNVPLGRGANEGKDLNSPEAMAAALFRPWRRSHETQALRWDPEEDQRYALRYGNPSKAGAPPTEHGANRLAALGLLSYPAMPSIGRAPLTPATLRIRASGEICFLWPLWTEPLSLSGIRRLLAHAGLTDPKPEVLRALGIAEILRTRRIPNGKYMSVTRAMSWRGIVKGDGPAQRA